MIVKPFGIPHADPDAALSPEEHLALELEYVEMKLKKLVARMQATPEFSGIGTITGAQRMRLITLTHDCERLRVDIAPHLRRQR